jgi:hypothetical protein
MSGLKSKTTPGDTLPARPYSYRRLDPKDGCRWGWGRREFGLRGQRRGTESDKGTAANSLSGYHAPGFRELGTDQMFDTNGLIELMGGRPLEEPFATRRARRAK